MAKSFMELIFIDSNNQALYTGLARSAATDAETRAEFNSYRRHKVDIKQARFLLDYHNRKGDLGDTIPIDDVGFTAITGQQPKPEADYADFDSEFWREVIRERDQERAA